MKRCLALLLAIVTILLPCGITVNAEGDLSENSKNMITFIKEKNNNLLVIRNNYAYMKLGAKWYSDVGVNYCLQMADLLIDTGSCPDKEKYMEVLINIIATYDMDNAADLSSQKKQDNLKSLKDYGMDAVKLATDAVSVYSGLDGIKGELSNAQDALSKAIDGVSVLIDNTNNWIDALTDLETFTQDYSNYNSFLKCIEDNADGDLKEATATLRNSMKQAFLLKLEAYGNVTSENFKNYTQFFFDDIFFDVVKSFDEYQTDETLSFFVNSAEGLYERINILNDSWELGKDIGKLIGNITVGGENLINRTLEIEALYDISVILQTKVLDSTTEFLSHSADSDADEYIDKYVTFANFLIGCRIRGEYCVYTILAEDSGLLALLSDKTDAQNWYDEQSSSIMRLKDRINSIKTSTVSTPTNEYTAEDLINKPVTEIVELMGDTFDVDKYQSFFYNNDVFPGLEFYVDCWETDESKLKEGIKKDNPKLIGIQVNDSGAGFRYKDNIITADMDFSALSLVFGEMKCKRGTGALISGAWTCLSYTIETDNCEATINFDVNWDVSKYLYSDKDVYVPQSEMEEHNPKIKNITIVTKPESSNGKSENLEEIGYTNSSNTSDYSEDDTSNIQSSLLNEKWVPSGAKGIWMEFMADNSLEVGGFYEGKITTLKVAYYSINGNVISVNRWYADTENTEYTYTFYFENDQLIIVYNGQKEIFEKYNDYNKNGSDFEPLMESYQSFQRMYAASVDAACKRYYASIVAGTLNSSNSGSVTTDVLPDKNAKASEKIKIALQCTIYGALQYEGITFESLSSLCVTEKSIIESKLKRTTSDKIIVNSLTKETTFAEMGYKAPSQ